MSAIFLFVHEIHLAIPINCVTVNFTAANVVDAGIFLAIAIVTRYLDFILLSNSFNQPHVKKHR